MLENPTDWKVLGLFAKNPTRSFFVNEIARQLKISPASSSTICKNLAKAGILSAKKIGNLLLYRMKNENFLAREAKKFLFLSHLSKYSRCLENDEYQAVALYGSYSSGEYVEKSDIDLLVITNVPKQKVYGNLEPLNELGEVSPTVLSLSQWLDMKKRADPFYKEVVANHIILHGERLAV